jgi:glutamine cyclotransferase
MYRLSISTICLVAITSLLLVGSCRDSKGPQSAPVYTTRALKTYPHDPQAFTQGLVYEDGFLYESTGLYGQSSLRKVAPTTGIVLHSRNLADEYFAEGITIIENRIIQLTWQSGTAFVYDKQTFKRLDTFEYEGEGWGITNDGTRLIMSDGTDKLRFIDPHTFAEYHSIQVRDGDTPVTNLNELEYIDGSIYANVWETTKIAIISPETGLVTAWIDLAGLYDPKGWAADAKVPNGIAHDPKEDRIFVTGKLWPNIYHIKLIPPE